MSNDPKQSQAADPRSIAESLLGGIEWIDSSNGYCRCPGEPCHTSSTKHRDCRIMLDRVPTVHCFHSSCRVPVEVANKTLRSAIAKNQFVTGQGFIPRRPTAAEIAAIKERVRLEKLKVRAKAALPDILAKHETTPAELLERSPYRLSGPANDHGRLLLQLFKPDDVIWIGQTTDSCPDEDTESRKAECRRHFRTVTEWRTLPTMPYQFTCPSIFKCGSHSRSNANVLFRRYLVMESDTLTKPQIGAVFIWCQQFMRLRAVVDTAGKSLHGWFDAPGTAAEKELRAILPELGCDPALFKLPQPCRMPGARRDEKTQALLYLDLEGIR